MSAELPPIHTVLRELSFWADGLVAHSPLTKWEYTQQGIKSDVVLGRTTVVAWYETSFPQQLHVAAWLGREAFEGAATYGACHLPDGPLVTWPMWADSLEHAQLYDSGGAAHPAPRALLDGMLGLLRIAEPVYELPAPKSASRRQRYMERLAAALHFIVQANSEFNS